MSGGCELSGWLESNMPWAVRPKCEVEREEAERVVTGHSNQDEVAEW